MSNKKRRKFNPKGKRIEIAPQWEIDMYEDLLDEFYDTILTEPEWRGALLTNESTLFDFFFLDEKGYENAIAKIKEIYGVEVKTGEDYFVDIFRKITEIRNS